MRSVCVGINVNDGRRMKMKLVYLVIWCRFLVANTHSPSRSYTHTLTQSQSMYDESVDVVVLALPQ